MNPTVLRRRLGLAMRKARTAAGLSAEKAGAAIEASQSKISRFEVGHGTLRVVELEALARYYGLDDEAVQNLVELLRNSRRESYWEQYRQLVSVNDYIEFEAGARAIRSYDLVIPGLFQTADYARACMRTNRWLTDEQIELAVEMRIRRQDRLRATDRPTIWAVVDEAALRRLIVPAGLMVKQLHALLEYAELPGVNVQILQFSDGAHPCIEAFSLLEFPDQPPLCYVEYWQNAIWMKNASEVNGYHERHQELVGMTSHMRHTPDIVRSIIDSW